MKIKASKLKAGHTIHSEYGDYGNFVDFKVNSVELKDEFICASCSTKNIDTEFAYRPIDFVEVLEDA